MTAGERFKSWIDATFSGWADRLTTWGTRMLTKGATKTLEDLEPGVIDQVSENIQLLIDNPATPPETKRMLQKAIKEGNIMEVALGWMLTAIGAIPMLLGQGAPLGRIMEQVQEGNLRSQILDPLMALQLWRRDKEKYKDVIDELRHGGWSEERIEAMKVITEIIPGVADIVRMAVREAFTPEIAEKFGQYEDFPEAIVPWLEKQGLSREWATRHWATHWGLPSASDGFELLHRGIIDEDILKMLLRANDIMPYWRDQLIKLSWNIPTRVDVRRFWDMRTIGETRLREIYTGLGYHAQDLEDYVLWTKIFVDFPDLLARYKNGWITLDEVKAELIAMGMKPERADTMIEEKIKKAAPERVAKERDLTAAEIIKGIKKGVITDSEGAELLQDMGYDSDEALFKIAIDIPQDEVEKVVAQRELTKAEIISGLKAAIITEGEARALLEELRYSSSDADFLLKIYQATISPPEAPRDKEASKADIVLAVKKGLITPEDGYLMLQDIGFSPEASQFILMVQAEASPFSPINFTEFKDITQKWRLATGMEGKPMTEELKKAAAEVVRLSGEVATMERAIKAEKAGLVEQEILPEETTKRLKGLQGKLHRAESALTLAKSEYDGLVAEWRHRE